MVVRGESLREDVGGIAVFAVDEGFGLGVAVGGDGAGRSGGRRHGKEAFNGEVTA